MSVSAKGRPKASPLPSMCAWLAGAGRRWTALATGMAGGPEAEATCTPLWSALCFFRRSWCALYRHMCADMAGLVTPDVQAGDHRCMVHCAGGMDTRLRRGRRTARLRGMTCGLLVPEGRYRTCRKSSGDEQCKRAATMCGSRHAPALLDPVAARLSVREVQNRGSHDCPNRAAALLLRGAISISAFLFGSTCPCLSATLQHPCSQHTFMWAWGCQKESTLEKPYQVVPVPTLPPY
ncbi:hypothetical protein T440DRAFT_504167 [Plenodomus tracheiphilus IPT5]|uniref:Uncharacterized protein n=1 Tax=Plenodomus tracheiphilus IPT5 TaxID=1408161 RepID=A0A6A7BLZ2_9PLEO|nr:hypothetical protein T440DRAFT_504167 [Plenodomus tracheiphilus IPT5]